MTVITIKFILNWYVFAYVYLYRIINFRKTTKLFVCFCFYIILLTFKNSEGAVVAVPDLPLCLGLLKHRASLARGDSSSCQKIFYDGFLLMWCNFKFEGVLFRSDSRHNDRVDSLLECATKQAVMTVAQWHRNQISRGLWLLAKKKLKMDSCLRGAILNLTVFCSIWTLIEERSSIK